MTIHTLTYPPGQTLSYAEYGDPNGFPILIQHGMVASIRAGERNLFQRLIDTGGRVICPARPGYGASSPYPMADVGEWGRIVSALVDGLGLAQFDVLGISSGAPYAYAIAAALPERVRNVFIISGTPALFDDHVRACWPYPVDTHASLPEMQRLAREIFFSHLSQSELEQDDNRDSLMNDCFGPGLDLKIRVLDWGFRLADIQAEVCMRHSRTDDAVPWTTAQITAGMLPNCRFETRENEVHFSQEVLDDFIRTAMAGWY